MVHIYKYTRQRNGLLNILTLFNKTIAAKKENYEVNPRIAMLTIASDEPISLATILGAFEAWPKFHVDG